MSQPQEGLNKKKAGRGKTTGTSVSKRRKKTATGKLNVFIPPNKMVAVGPNAPDFVTEISVLVQKNAPLNVKQWKDVPKETKEDIVSRVYDSFHIDVTEHHKDVILATAKRLYRNHRARLHDHFKQYETNEVALEHKPDDISEGDWEYLVNYFSSDKFKAMSARNKSNKAKQFVNHRCGRKSFQAVSYDARDPETEKEPNYQDLWQMTHTNNNGEWINEASREVHMKVQEESTKRLENIDVETEKDPIINDAFKSVLGERSGYCRGLGAGIQPTKGKSNTTLHEQLNSERVKRQSIELKLAEVEAHLQEERSKREEMSTRMEDNQRQLEEREKQFQERVEKELDERMEKKLQEKMAAIFMKNLVGLPPQG